MKVETVWCGKQRDGSLKSLKKLKVPDTFILMIVIGRDREIWELIKGQGRLKFPAKKRTTPRLSVRQKLWRFARMAVFRK